MSSDSPTDDRVVSDGRITLSRPLQLAERLAAVYPADEYPSLESEQDLWLRAAEELALEHEQGGGSPTDIHRTLVEMIEKAGGTLPISVVDGGFVLATSDGGVRARTQQTDASTGEIEHMDIDELSPAQLADLLDGVDSEQLYRSLAVLAVASDEISIEEGVLQTADHAGVDAQDLLAYAIEDGRYTISEFRAILDDLEPGE